MIRLATAINTRAGIYRERGGQKIGGKLKYYKKRLLIGDANKAAQTGFGIR